MARQITGASESGWELLESLCTAAMAQWESRLLEGVEVEDCEEAFFCAATMTAAADFLAAWQSAAGVDFTAGEISVKTKTAGDIAGRMAIMRRAAEEVMKSYVAGGDFAFLEVKG